MTHWALMLLLAAGPAPAPAADTDAAAKAKTAFQNGQKLYKQGRYAEAIAQFEAAYAARPHPVVFFNIARCHEQLDDVPKGLRAYRDYLRLAPDAKDRDAVNDAIANLERKLREKGLQQMLIFAVPADARIEVNGKDLGVSPASIELIAGPHKLVVRAPGYDTVERSFTMTLARAAEMTINLSPTSATTPAVPPPPKPQATAAASPPRPADAPVVGAPAAVGPASPTVALTPSHAATPPAKRGRTWTYVAGGVAVASAGAGIGMGLVASSASSQMLAEQRSKADVQALYNQAQGLSTGANVAYTVAGVAAITAVVLFFVEGQ